MASTSKRAERGHVLLTALVFVLIFVLLSMTLLKLATQDAPAISVMREHTQAQHLAEAAADLVVGWFHDPSTAPSSLSGLLAKRVDTGAGPSYFDAAGRSQFSGTSEKPDILLDASNDSDARLLNGSSTGFNGGLSELGRLDRLKMYAPTQPGLLGTVEVTASTKGRRPLASTIRVQLGALNIPAIRAAVQSGEGLGVLKSGGSSRILAHWGDVRVMGDVVIDRMNDLVLKSTSAPVTGLPYEPARTLEDRWVDYWIGGDVSVLSPSALDSAGFPGNVYRHQHPTPGIALDRWDYGLLKKTAQRHGTYYRLDREGRLHPLGVSDSDPGLAPADVLTSSTIGHSQGLVFIDTLDGEAPRLENLGTLVLDSDYVEALLVVQGHIVIRPKGAGRSFTVLSPPPEGTTAMGGRVPVTLSDIHVNGLLFAAGTITVERESRIYGAVVAAGSLNARPELEVWYNADFGRGFFRGLPVVYRAPSTWQAKY